MSVEMFRLLRISSGIHFLLLVTAEYCDKLDISLEKADNWINQQSILTKDILFGRILANGMMPKTTEPYGSQCKNNSQLLDTNIHIQIAFRAFENTEVKLKRPLLHNLLRKESFYIPTLETYLENIEEGTPNGIQSDMCIAQLLATKSCVISTYCMDLIVANNLSKGYHKTHQALLALLLQMNNCIDSLKINTSLRIILANICSNIFRETITIGAHGFPSLLRDLLLEQMLVCSLAGFNEFFNDSLVSQALSYQTEAGCFTMEVGGTGKCENHMTGIGLAFLSFLTNKQAI